MDKDLDTLEHNDTGGDERFSHIPENNSRLVGDPDDLAAEFACSVCMHIAIHPTTLVCGHTSCRLCLAQWYFTSQKKECPLCRQPYQGHPKINTHIRNMIAKLFPTELREREFEQFASAENAEIIRKYDEVLAKETASNTSNIGGFCLGVGLAFGVVIIAYLAWYWQFSERNLLVMKPVQYWKSKDVAAWLQDLSWASEYANSSTQNNIDGNMLLVMNEVSLTKFLNVSDEVHQRALLLAIDGLKQHGVKMPSTLWEYKAVYPGRCLFLVDGLNQYPRTTFVYMWMYFYDEMFLPFVRATTESTNEIEKLSESVSAINRISASQWVSFLFSAVVLPQWLVIVLAYRMFSYHFFTPMIVIITAIAVQILEILDLVSLFRYNFNIWNVLLIWKNYGKQLLHAFMFMVAWPLIPGFICDVFFYTELYIRPFFTLSAVYRRLRQEMNVQ